MRTFVLRLFAVLLILTACLSAQNPMQRVISCEDAGASDTYACNAAVSPGSYVTGMVIRFKANTANTGVASINVSSVGALTIKKVAGGVTTDLTDNDIRAGQWVTCVYDGTNCQMQSQLGNTATGSTTVNGQTCSIGGSCTPTAKQSNELRVLGYELVGTGSAGVLQAADFTAAFGACINNSEAKTLTRAYCLSDTGSQQITLSVGGSARFTITCVTSASFSTSTTDGTTGYIVAASMNNTAVAANAILDITGTANGSTKDIKVFAYGTVN